MKRPMSRPAWRSESPRSRIRTRIRRSIAARSSAATKTATAHTTWNPFTSSSTRPVRRRTAHRVRRTGVPASAYAPESGSSGCLSPSTGRGSRFVVHRPRPMLSRAGRGIHRGPMVLASRRDRDTRAQAEGRLADLFRPPSGWVPPPPPPVPDPDEDFWEPPPRGRHRAGPEPNGRPARRWWGGPSRRPCARRAGASPGARRRPRRSSSSRSPGSSCCGPRRRRPGEPVPVRSTPRGRRPAPSLRGVVRRSADHGIGGRAAGTTAVGRLGWAGAPRPRRRAGRVAGGGAGPGRVAGRRRARAARAVRWTPQTWRG